MNKLTILDKKTFTVGQRAVKVTRQFAIGSAKPHQVVIRAHIQGIKKVQTTCYPDGAIGNASAEYAHFDEDAAKQFIERFDKFLGTVKGQNLAEGGHVK
jgi:hypothetical protein